MASLDVEEEMAFFRQAVGKAIAYRLSFAQSMANDHQMLERVLPNLWEAVQQSYHQQAWESVLAFRDTLQLFLDLRGHWKQSVLLNEWACQGALAHGDRVNFVRWTHDRADILHQQGNYREAERLYRTCEDTYRSLGEHFSALKSRHMRALVLRAEGRLLEAEHCCKTTIAEVKNLGLKQWLAHPLYVLALLVRDQGQILQAEQHIEQGLALLTSLSDPKDDGMIAQCYHFLGETALLRGDLGTARRQLERSLALSQQVGIIRRVAATQRVLGDLARAEKRYGEAERLYNEALKIVARLGDQPELAKLLFSRAKLMIQLKQRRDGIVLLRGALSTFQEIGDSRGVIIASALLGQLYLWHGLWLRALQLWLVVFRTASSSGLLRLRLLWRFRAWWMLLTLGC